MIDWQEMKVTCRTTGQLLFELQTQPVSSTVCLISAQEAERACKTEGSTFFVAKLRSDEAELSLKTDFGTSCDAKLRDLLDEFAEVLEEPSKLPPSRPWDHRIELESEETPNLPTYRMSPAELKEVQRQLEDPTF